MNIKQQVSVRFEQELLARVDKVSTNRTEALHYFVRKGLSNHDLVCVVRGLHERIQKIEEDVAANKNKIVDLKSRTIAWGKKFNEIYNWLPKANDKINGKLAGIAGKVAEAQSTLRDLLKISHRIGGAICVLALGGLAWWVWFAKHFSR